MMQFISAIVLLVGMRCDHSFSGDVVRGDRLFGDEERAIVVFGNEDAISFYEL
jgi:hypothetical protein